MTARDDGMRRLADLSDRFEAALARITCTCGHTLNRHNENGCTADVIVNDARRTCLCGFLDNPEVR